MVRHVQIVIERVWTILVFQQKSMVRRFSPRWYKSHKPRTDQNFWPTQPTCHKFVKGRLTHYPIMVGNSKIVIQRVFSLHVGCSAFTFSSGTHRRAILYYFHRDNRMVQTLSLAISICLTMNGQFMKTFPNNLLTSWLRGRKILVSTG